MSCKQDCMNGNYNEVAKLVKTHEFTFLHGHMNQCQVPSGTTKHMFNEDNNFYMLIKGQYAVTKLPEKINLIVLKTV